MEKLLNTWYTKILMKETTEAYDAIQAGSLLGFRIDIRQSSLNLDSPAQWGNNSSSNTRRS